LNRYRKFESKDTELTHFNPKIVTKLSEIWVGSGISYPGKIYPGSSGKNTSVPGSAILGKTKKKF
jgi:hypothetical protein